MIKILRIIAWVSFLTILYFNVFMMTSDIILIAFYPYLLGVTFIAGFLFIGLYFINHIVITKILKGFLAVIFAFEIFTLIQVWRNAKLVNGYQTERSQYMDEMMRITKMREGVEDRLGRQQEGISTLIEVNTGIPLTYYNKVALLKQEKEIFDVIVEEIDKAKHHIHIEFFIIRDDQIGGKFRDLLVKKANQGVKVRIVYDGLGSHEIKSPFLKPLKQAGVEIAIYDPVIPSIIKGKLNHRNHRKIIVIDGTVAFTGGVNIGDEYLGRDENIGPWKDTQVKVEGEAVVWFQKVFLADWYYATGEKILDHGYFPQPQTENRLPVQVITGGYDTHWNEMSQMYFSLISAAQEKVYIHTPYLILNDSMLKALQTAALRGVDVRIIVPKKADYFLVGWANASYYEKLLKAKVKIYQYERGYLHSKMMMIDQQILSVGSANFNMRSLYLDYEMNVIIFDQDLCWDAIKEFDKNLKNSDELFYEEYQKRSLLQRGKEVIGRLIVPMT